MPATVIYYKPLPTTFDHIIGCFLRMSRGNILFFKNSCENEVKRNYSIYGATCCGFCLGLQQSLVVEFFSPFEGGLWAAARLQRRCLARAGTYDLFGNGFATSPFPSSSFHVMLFKLTCI